MSEISCSLWETSSNRLPDAFCFWCYLLLCNSWLRRLGEDIIYLGLLCSKWYLIAWVSAQHCKEYGMNMARSLICSAQALLFIGDSFSSSTLMRVEIYCSLSLWVCFWILETSYLHIIICLKCWYEYHSLWFGNNCLIFHRDAEHYLSLAVFMGINDA